MASPALFHNWIGNDIHVRFHVFLREHPYLGKVTSETDFRLAPNTVRRPVVAFISAAKLESVDPRKRLDLAPDLAVEIASPNDDLPRKIQDYLAAGTQVWALYPDARIAQIRKPGEQAFVRDADARDSLEDDELSPGLRIPLAEIFG